MQRREVTLSEFGGTCHPQDNLPHTPEDSPLKTWSSVEVIPFMPSSVTDM